MSLGEVSPALDRWAKAGERAAVATLVEVRRSAPRPAGARFAVSSAGELAGSISSGCVEGDLHEHLLDVLAGGAPSIITYGITDEMAAGVGLSCGGEIEVLLTTHEPDDPAWTAVAAADAVQPIGGINVSPFDFEFESHGLLATRDYFSLSLPPTRSCVASRKVLIARRIFFSASDSSGGTSFSSFVRSSITADT